MAKQSKRARDEASTDWLAGYKVLLDTTTRRVISSTPIKLDPPDEQDFLSDLLSTTAAAKPTKSLSNLHDTATCLENNSNELAANTPSVTALIKRELDKNPLTLGKTWQEDFDQTTRCLEAGYGFTQKRIEGVSRRDNKGLKVEEGEKRALDQLGVNVEEQQEEQGLLGLKGMEEKLGDLVKGGRRIVKGLPETQL